MNNKIYDILKWTAQIFLPALGTQKDIKKFY